MRYDQFHLTDDRRHGADPPPYSSLLAFSLSGGKLPKLLGSLCPPAHRSLVGEAKTQTQTGETTAQSHEAMIATDLPMARRL
jgi:hypothetical protein